MKKQLINLNPVKEQVKQKLIEKYDTTLYMNTNKIELKLDVEDILNEYIEAQHIEEPTVYITPNAYIKMRMLVDKSDKEVGWYGIVNKMPGLNNVYIIEDIVVYPQKVTGATVEQDDDKMFEFEMSLTTEQVNHKRFHGHSHVNMSTSPSGVDENFYQELLSQVTDYFIITITNKRNEYTTRFYDVANNIMYEDVPIQLIQDDGTLYLDWYDSNKDKIQEPEPVIHNYYSSGYSSGYSSSYMKSERKGKKTKQQSLFDDVDDDKALPFWDPNLYDYITPGEYEDIYGRKYDGEYDNYYTNLKRKAGKKSNGKNKCR